MAYPVQVVPQPDRIEISDAMLGNPRIIHASPEARLEALAVASGGGQVLWVCEGPKEMDWEFRSTIQVIMMGVTPAERLATRLLGRHPDWSGEVDEVRHVSGGRVKFWCERWGRMIGGLPEALHGMTFELKVVG